MNDVFISYSRRNKEFTQKLYNALLSANRTVWADWNSIPAASDWFAEIKEGIEQTNSVLFILSPEWIKSNECRKELNHAVAMGKRLLPILYETVDPNDVPSELSKINWIYMRDTDDFGAAFKTLCTAIDTDLDWIKTHTRLQIRAVEWNNKNRDHSFVLRGKDLSDGEQFIASAAGKEPEVTALQGEYVLVSRKDATRRQRLTLAGVVIALIISVALGVVAFFQRQEAIAAKIKAEEAQTQAEEAQKQAEQAQARAEAETRKANSGVLSLEAENALDQYPQRALLLALEAVRVNEEAGEPVMPDAEEALRAAIERTSGLGLSGFPYEVNFLQFTKDNRWLIAGTSKVEGEIKIWNLEKLHNEQTYQPFSISFPIDQDQEYQEDTYEYEFSRNSKTISLSPQTTWLVVKSKNSSELWQISTEDENRKSLKFEGKLEFTKQNDDNFVLEVLENKVIYWEIIPETLEKKELQTFKGNFVSLSDDRSLLLINEPNQGILLWNLHSLIKTPIVLTKLGLDVITGAYISPTNDWVIFSKNTSREEYQIPLYDETYTYQIGTEAWNSTSLILVPIKQNKKQEYVVDLNFAIDVSIQPSFSPNGNAFVYYGYNPPNQTPNDNGTSIGLLRFNNLEFSNLTYSSIEDEYSAIKFINNDWLYASVYSTFTYNQKGRFIDIREDDLSHNGETSLLPLLDSQGNISFSDDGKYIVTETGELINFEQLDINHYIAIESASQVSDSQSSNEIELALNNNPQGMGFEENLSQIAKSSDDKWIAAGSLDGSLRIWNKNNPNESSSLLLKYPSSYIALSNDNQWLGINETIWKLEEGVPVKEYKFEETTEEFFSPVYLGVFSPDSRWFIYICLSEKDNLTSVKIIDLSKLSTNNYLDSLKINSIDSRYSTLQFSSDSHWVLLGDDGAYSEDGTESKHSFLYDIQQQKSIPLPVQSTKFTFTENNKYILLGIEDPDTYGSWKKTEFWSLPEDKSSDLVKVQEIVSAGQLVFSSNGQWIAILPPSLYDENQKDLELWDSTCVLQKATCDPFYINANNVSFSLNSEYMVTQNKISEEESLYTIWSLKSKAPEIFTSKEISDSMLNIGYNGDTILLNPIPKTFGSSPLSNTAGLFSNWQGYDLNGYVVTTFNGYGHVLYGGGGGGEPTAGTYQTDIKVTVLSSQNHSSNNIVLRGHESYISSTLISPDESLALTYTGYWQDDGGPRENKLRLWQMNKLKTDPTTKPIILPVSEQREVLQALAFSPDSKWIYIIDSKNRLHFIPTSIKVLKEQACAAAGRNLILNEWERYFPNIPYRKTCDNLPEHPSIYLK